MQGWCEEEFWCLSDEEKINWIAYYELRNEEDADAIKRQERQAQLKQKMRNK